MKRSLCILLVLSLLIGCGPKVVSPQGELLESVAPSFIPDLPSEKPSAEPTPFALPEILHPPLPTYAPRDPSPVLFPEELLALQEKPFLDELRSLLISDDLTKGAFAERFRALIRQVDAMDKGICDLWKEGRTITAGRKEQAIDLWTSLLDKDTADDLEKAYAACSGEGADLPITEYCEAVATFLSHVRDMEERQVPFFDLDSGASDYITVLSRCMGEPVDHSDVFSSLEQLLQTEAYAISAALQADPEAARKKIPISMGDLSQNLSFLRKVANDLCPLPDGSSIPLTGGWKADEKKDLFELAYSYCPGMQYLKLYAAHASNDQQSRWANAPEGYLRGLSLHNSYAIIPFMEDFELDYLQYQWYEQTLDVTLTGMTALLIHYYGYTTQDLADYLKGWGAEGFTGYLYNKAMTDPFNNLVAAYGYFRYLEICQAALDSGCENEERFLRDYLAAGPAPYESLKAYMVSLYQNEG
jgi:hypothetical protein